MDYDFRNRAAQPNESHAQPMYGRPSSGSVRASSASYPVIGQSGYNMAPPMAARPSSTQPNPQPSSGLGIRVAIKPQYRITPPPQLAPLPADIPRSAFQFDFGFERKVLAEAEKENPNWSRFVMESSPSKTAESTSLSSADSAVNKYVALGLGREAVILAVSNYGDNPAKVQEFVKAYNLLREMGFASKNVAEVLVMFDNNADKALAHFLNSSS